MDVAGYWRTQPAEWQPLFRTWHARYPERTRLHAWPQWGGERLLALSIAPTGRLRGRRRLPLVRLLVAVPHAHEPASTAAAVDVACQLLSGVHLDGTPSALESAHPRRAPLVTLLPDGNPQGRVRSPRRCWDGTTCDNEGLWREAFGVAADGGRFPRLPEWRLSEQRPCQIGLTFESLSEDLYVEPNTSRLSTYSRALDDLFARFRYTHMLEMHQHAWPDAVLLPDDFDASPPDVRAAAMGWAQALLAAWRAAGADPRPAPAVPCRGQPRQQLRQAFWRGRFPGMLRLASEVRQGRLEPGGGEPTPQDRQMRLACVALEASLRHVAEA